MGRADLPRGSCPKARASSNTPGNASPRRNPCAVAKRKLVHLRPRRGIRSGRQRRMESGAFSQSQLRSQLRGGLRGWPRLDRGLARHRAGRGNHVQLRLRPGRLRGASLPMRRAGMCVGFIVAEELFTQVKGSCGSMLAKEFLNLHHWLARNQFQRRFVVPIARQMAGVWLL
jgi:hypothetical protein